MTEGAFSVRVTLTVLVMPPLFTVIVVELFPWIALAVLILAVMVPLLEPDVGLSDSQEAPSLTVHVPFELMAMVLAEGLAAPCVAVYVTLPGDAVNATSTVRLTGMVTAAVPTALMVIAVLYVPIASEPALTVNTMEPVSLPEAGLRVSHGAGAAAFQFNVPLPIFVTVRVRVVELLFPC